MSRSRRSWGERKMAKSRWVKEKEEEEEKHKEMEEERRIMNKEPSTTRLQ